jgi:hypothetical protein
MEKSGENIPQYQVTSFKIHLLERATALLEPLDILFLEDEEVFEVFLLWRLILMVVLLPLLAEELVIQLAATLHQNQASIIRAVGLVVQ